MNAQNQGPAIQGPPAQNDRGRGRGGRGRGRGGRGRPSQVPTGAQAPVDNKIGPARPADLKYIDDSSLKKKSFVVWMGAGEGLPRQVTFHRPIGVTPLGQTEWVVTPTSEVGLLLERKSSEAVSRYEREMAVAVRTAVLTARLGRKLNREDPPQEVWIFEGSPTCGAHIRTLQETCRTQERSDSEWLEIASQAIKDAERVFKTELQSAERRTVYERAHPRPVFETKGGPAGDRSQLAVAYLRGLTLSAARDRVAQRLFGTTTA